MSKEIKKEELTLTIDEAKQVVDIATQAIRETQTLDDFDDLDVSFWENYGGLTEAQQELGRYMITEEYMRATGRA